MHISGLVLTLTHDPVVASAALTELVFAGPFTVGAANGSCRAAVMETEDAETASGWHHWLAALPGVESVDVVFVHWDEVKSEVSHGRA